MARPIKNVAVTRCVSEAEKHKTPCKYRSSLTRRVTTCDCRCDIFYGTGHKLRTSRDRQEYLVLPCQLMAFLFTLSIVSAVALSNMHSGGNLGHPTVCCLASLLCVLIPLAVAVAFRTRILDRLNRDPDNARRYMRVYLHSERCVAVMWFVSVCLVVFVCRWPAIVRDHWEFGEAILLDELLILLPIVLPLFLQRAIAFDVERWAKQHARRNHPRLSRRWHFAWSQSRVDVGVAIAPILLVTTCWDLCRVFLPRFAQGGSGWALMLLPLVAGYAAVPLFLRLLWTTTALTSGSLRSDLLLMAKRAKLPIRNIIVCHTPHQVPNAAVTGILPSLTYVVLTDGLMRRFDDDGIKAAFAHELGHIGCQHNTLRMFALLLPATLFGLLFKILASSVSPAFNAYANLLVQPGMCLFFTVCYLVFAFGWFCRQLEHQADVFACRILISTGDDAMRDSMRARLRTGDADTVRDSAATCYLSVLQKLSAASPPHRRQWLHPSFDQRSRFLCEALQNGVFYRQFERRLGLAGLTLKTLVVGSLVVCIALAS